MVLTPRVSFHTQYQPSTNEGSVEIDHNKSVTEQIIQAGIVSTSRQDLPVTVLPRDWHCRQYQAMLCTHVPGLSQRLNLTLILSRPAAIPAILLSRPAALLWSPEFSSADVSGHNTRMQTSRTRVIGLGRLGDAHVKEKLATT
ncbi:hypothetical protein BaRGS_00021616 [Batillaria attramentaria]|uniref:Uncharacterized protein n=1 Tax=Batillaria attramentaria TaxID=370345 RepID=A0ABD0KIR6_9CAEN